MTKTPNRKRRAAKVLGAADPVLDAELRAMTDEQLIAAYEDAESAPKPEPPRHVLFGYMEDLSDDELVAEYHAAHDALAAELPTKTDAELKAMLRKERGEGSLAELIMAEQGRRRPQPEPIAAPTPIPAPVVEPHPVTLPDPGFDPQLAAPTETPRQAWARRQHEAISAAIADEMASAQREHDETARLRDVGTYDGPDLGEILKSKRG